MSTSTPPPSPPMRDRRGFVYTPAIGSRLKPLLWVTLIGFALLGANGAYLASVSLLEWARGTLQQTYFYMLMFILHLVLGFALIVPFLIFGFAHLATSWKRPNKAAIRYGLILLTAGVVVLVTGLVLVRVEGVIDVRDPAVRSVSYWLHVIIPVLAVGLYLRHRMAGPRVRWEYAKVWVGSVAAFVLLMGLFHSHDPRSVRQADPKYTFPSSVRLAGGKLISEETMMMDKYCLECHQDAYEGWFHSSHHFSSFNNPAYLFAVRETRRVSLERDGDTRAARWCAGCHDPVPFFSGAFDDPAYDDVNTASSQAGITCTACHAIIHVDSTRGNAHYTIEEPQHYPFANSDNPALQWINRTMVKAKPEMHKKTFLKPEVHRDSKFCSTCHKVSLPFALNHYQEFTRGQNHWDNFVLSGVSGGGARSFYYPPEAKTECAACHMPLKDSKDFGAQDFDGDGGREIHDHFFVGANTALPAFRGRDDLIEKHREFLKDKVRIDLFGLRTEGRIDGELIAPLRPEAPTLEPGSSYLAEVVVRTLGVGHLFSQGTVDSNEIWVELLVKGGDGAIVGHSGGIGPDGTVDPYAHFINVYMLDREGNRIDRRNPQDIFVPLYNKQIPPGAGQIVHFALEVPEGVAGPLTLEAKVNYRKFDRKYMDYIFGEGLGPELPVIELAKDSLALAVAGGMPVENPPSPIADEWQRWNDYGIGLLLEGSPFGMEKGELRQAREVFNRVAGEYDKVDGYVNLARVLFREADFPGALDALEQAAAHDPPPAAPWTITWLTGQVNAAYGNLDEAIENFRSVLATRIPERNFDFSGDYEIINELGLALYNRGRIEPRDSAERREFMEEAVATWRRTLEIDSENIAAHYGLGLVYADFARGRQVEDLPVVSYDQRWEGEGATVAEITDKAAATTESPLDPLIVAARAHDLEATIARFLDEPRPEYHSRLDPLHVVVDMLGAAHAQQTNPASRAALAATLAATHKAMHAMFRPDETAAGRAVAIARRNNPAADLNASSIVIHPLHPPGDVQEANTVERVRAESDPSNETQSREPEPITTALAGEDD